MNIGCPTAANSRIPDDLRIYWDMQCYMRGEAERASSLGAVYVTNVQQLYERPDNANSDEPEEMTAVLGPKPPAGGIEVEDFIPRIIARRGPAVVVNDEAHHTHDEESEWNQTIRRLHSAVSGGLAGQFDFTATPRHTKGQLFSWTVFDYPLKPHVPGREVRFQLRAVWKQLRKRIRALPGEKLR